VSQYQEDGLLALFPGGPKDAVKAAIGILDSVDARNRDLARSSSAQQAVRVCAGIDTGPLLVGTIGSDEHIECSVIGESIELAPRVEAIAQSVGARLLVSAGTRAGLRENALLDIREIDGTSLDADFPHSGLFEVCQAGRG
jgi:class 3 adenylate cyclase